MTSYFDEDIASEDNDFDSVSTTSSNESEPKAYSKKMVSKKIGTEQEQDQEQDDLEDDDLIQYGGVEDFIEEEVEGDLDIEEDEEELENEELNNDLDLNDNDNEIKNKSKQLKSLPSTNDMEMEEEDELENEENYLKKFDKEINKNYIMNFHPECITHNYDEVEALTKVVRDKNNIIIDDLHKTIPYLTKYERTRIIGQRAKQINAGGTAFVKVPENVLDGYLIAELELKEKRIPFIIRRPLPNGGSEYWNVRDLENISF